MRRVKAIVLKKIKVTHGKAAPVPVPEECKKEYAVGGVVTGRMSSRPPEPQRFPIIGRPVREVRDVAGFDVNVADTDRIGQMADLVIGMDRGEEATPAPRRIGFTQRVLRTAVASRQPQEATSTNFVGIDFSTIEARLEDMYAASLINGPIQRIEDGVSSIQESLNSRAVQALSELSIFHAAIPPATILRSGALSVETTSEFQERMAAFNGTNETPPDWGIIDTMSELTEHEEAYYSHMDFLHHVSGLIAHTSESEFIFNVSRRNSSTFIIHIAHSTVAYDIYCRAWSLITLSEAFDWFFDVDTTDLTPLQRIDNLIEACNTHANNGVNWECRRLL